MPKAKKKKTGSTRIRSTRTTKDGRYHAVNVYLHVELLDKLDDEAETEGRTRRAQLERVLCRAFEMDPAELSKGKMS
ncbi:hypothetical protein LCGC14_0663160 [marine sediment metagenome]|uniref:Uncharacterized protein n=1 Tax=marine sediment metagenome TaxID=412755 RepID=A0A0F9U193_9ZZZZ